MAFHILFWAEFDGLAWNGHPEEWVQLGPFSNLTVRDGYLVDGYGEEERLIARREDGLGWRIYGLQLIYSEFRIEWEDDHGRK